MLLRRFAGERLTSLSPVMLIVSGVVLIVGGLVWPRATALHGNMSASGVDFIQGFVVGIGISCEIMGVGSLLAGRAKRPPFPRD